MRNFILSLSFSSGDQAWRSKLSYLTIERHNIIGSFHFVVAWIECNWLHGRRVAVKAYLALQCCRFISFRWIECNHKHVCTTFGTYCAKGYEIGTNVTNQREGSHGCVIVCLHRYLYTKYTKV